MNTSSTRYSYPYDRLHRIAAQSFIESSASILDEVQHLESPFKEELFVSLVLAADEDRRALPARQIAA